MGFYKLLAFLIALTVMLTPLLSLKGTRSGDTEKPKELTSESDEQSGESPKADGRVKVLLKEEGEVIEVELREYLLGVLAAEMPATYHEEALKAQAVTAYTYLLYRRGVQAEKPDATLKGADLSDDSSTHQGYLTAEAREKKWGDKAKTYEKKLTEAIEAVSGEVITFEGKPIMAAFHAINSGVTNSAKTVWGGDVAYLQSVVSTGDRLSPDCTKTVVIKADELSRMLNGLEGCELSGEAEDWLGEIRTHSSGYVTGITAGGKEYNGAKFREAAGLRSATFTYEYKSGSFRFTTEGYGHGVGLSQYGADYMARQGSTWDEIIRHYYTGVEIEKI
ncbi:MAG: stage II sporulation protein D [Clostridia bacterium]|nr:stage II sporulation protein D [Clostridia bacterium]